MEICGKMPDATDTTSIKHRALTLTVRTPQCGHAVWGKFLSQDIPLDHFRPGKFSFSLEKVEGRLSQSEHGHTGSGRPIQNSSGSDNFPALFEGHGVRVEPTRHCI